MANCAVFGADWGQIGSPDLEIGTPDFVFPRARARVRARSLLYAVYLSQHSAVSGVSPERSEPRQRSLEE